MKQAWRVHRVALAGAGVALIAATPAIVAAARVANPWALAAATAVATVTVGFCGIALYQDRHRRQRHGGQVLRVHDGCLLLADGSLPMARQVADPARLRPHAAPAEGDSPAAAGEVAPPAYVPRDVDGELAGLLAAGGFVLVVGDSGAGKSRTAFEGIRATLPDHTLIAPAGIDAVAAAVSRAAAERRCVLWLDDLERFLGPGGISAADIRQLLGGRGQHRVIVATIRAAEQARLTTDSASGDRARQAHRDVRAVLKQARQLQLARMFTPAELARAGTRDWDPRIAEASQHADSYGIAEYLTAGPALLRAFEDARNSSAGNDARGAAIVAAAIDIRRAGYLSPIPRRLLDEIHGYYLPGPEQGRMPREPVTDAWAWATAPRSAATALLQLLPGGRVADSDYLTDAVQRAAGPLDRVLEPVIRSALATASAADAASLARTAHNQGRWQLAADAWLIACQLLASDPAFGHEHPDTLTARGNLALVLHDLGRLDDAEAGNRAVLAARRRALGPGHPDTLTTRTNLAAVLHDLGRLDDAESQHRAVLAARQRALGPDHAETLAARSSLAGVLHDLGRLDEAAAEFRAVLEIRQRVLGADHPGTLTSRSNLALVLRGLGRLEEAAAEHRAVLEVRQLVPGPDHPDTLTTRGNLAGVLRELGRLEEAEAEHRTVLAARQLVLGADHPDSLASRHNLARVLRDLGWLDEAEAEIRAVLAIRQRVLGPDHPSTLASRNNLAGVLHDRGQLEQAEAEIRAVLAIMQRVMGPDHPDTRASRDNLALVLRDLGRAEGDTGDDIQADPAAAAEPAADVAADDAADGKADCDAEMVMD